MSMPPKRERSRHSAANQEDPEVTLYVKIAKTVTLNVKSSEKIENIRALVKDAVPNDLLELVISGNKLKDGNRLNDYITVGNSIVDVVCQESRLKINVKRMSMNGIISVGVEVKMNDTIQLVKFLINSQEGSKSDEYLLIFDGEQLEDGMTVEDCGLKDDSVVYMVPCPRDTVPLRIEMPSGLIERISVKPLSTIFNLKVVLQRNIKMPIDEWHLAYSRKRLEDLKTVAYCGLEADSLLTATPNASVQIFVQSLTGKLTTIFIKPTDTVLSLKKQIFDKEDIPIKMQRLVFSGKQLEESQRIMAYGIHTDSTVQLILRLGGSIC